MTQFKRYLPESSLKRHLLAMLMLMLLSTSLFLIFDRPAYDKQEDGTVEMTQSSTILLDSQNNTVIIGYIQSSTHPNTFSGGRLGMADVFVTKYSPGGALLWSRFLGGNRTDLATGAAMDQDDNIVVIGVTSSRDFPSSNSSHEFLGNQELFIVKLASNGTLLWSSLFGGSHTYWSDTNSVETIEDVTITSEGDIVVVGQSYNYDFPGFDGGFNYYHPMISYVRALQKNGSFSWTHVYRGFYQDSIYQVLSMDNTIIVGTCENERYFRENNGMDFDASAPYPDVDSNQELQDIRLSRYNINGTELGHHFLGGSGYECPSDMALDSENNLILAGTTTSVDLVPNQEVHGESDAFVLKLDQDDTLVWGRTFGGRFPDGLNRDQMGVYIGITPEDEIILAGSTASPDFPSSSDAEFQGDYDAFVICFDSTGVMLWSKIFGGRGLDVVSDLILVDQEIVVLGYTGKNDLFSQHEDYAGVRDIFLVSYSVEGEFISGRYI